MHNEWLLVIIPLASYCITQSVKLAFDGIKGNYNIQHMWSTYGGMPSAHSAFVVSLATIVGLHEGLKSAAFAICIVFSVLALRDAMGFRRQLGRQATVINALRAHLSDREQKNLPQIVEQIGHTPLEVFVGSIFGFIIALLGWTFF